MIELLRTRRSIRKYTGEPLDEKLKTLIREALLRSPSSRGINPWEFVLVDDPELLVGLSRCKPHGSSFVRDAKLAVVVCGDETKTDVWVEDCSIASIIAHLCAHALGLGSCWVQIRGRMYSEKQTAENYIQMMLGLPAHMRVESLIAMGYPGEIKTGVEYDHLQFEKVHINRYGNRP